MRSRYVFLGLVTLTFLHVSSGQVCTNWFVGVQRDDICCDVGCETCGGGGCASRPGGADNCCSSRIEESGVLCSVSGEAPCIVDNDQVCSNWFVGVQTANICCDVGCGTCGGGGCASRPGGAENCCMGSILDSGVLCSVNEEAPCIIDNEKKCSNLLIGVENTAGDVCCEEQCGTCGGSGCAMRPGGSSSCCMGTIRASGDMCSVTMAAPCIVDDPLLCSNGVPGVEEGGICCKAHCETCGGSGCAQRPGGPDNCCSGRIVDSGVLCSTTGTAPCIIDDGAPL